MRFHTYKRLLCGGMAVMMLAMSGCTVIDKFKAMIGQGDDPAPLPTPKPQVTVEYGDADPVVLDLQEGVPTSYLNADNFGRDSKGRITYQAAEGDVVMTGIDVSEHQQYPDWDKVAADGIDFAMIRLGYRGSSEGMLYKDPIFRYNLVKAHNAGLKIGIYFFSQATCRAEAVAEAHYVLAVLEEHRDKITMPVVFDWEETGTETSRTKGMNGEAVTDCAKFFTDIIREGGYQPGVYFNRHMGYYLYDLAQLPDVTFWFAGTGDYSDFYYEHSIWQYTFNGKVDGVAGDVDINLFVAPEGSIDITEDTVDPVDTDDTTEEAGTTEGEVTEGDGETTEAGEEA